jgi:hypothetical protein
MEKHNAYFYGIKKRVKYGVSCFSKPKLYKTNEFVDYFLIEKAEIPNSLLGLGEKVKLDVSNMPLNINNRARNLDGSVNYYTDFVKIVEDKLTEQSKIESEKIINRKRFLFW